MTMDSKSLNEQLDSIMSNDIVIVCVFSHFLFYLDDSAYFYKKRYF